MKSFTVTSAGRADHFLKSIFPAASMRRIKQIFDAGHVRRTTDTGAVVKKGDWLGAGNVVVVLQEPELPEHQIPVPEETPLSILFENDDYLVINKPAGRPCFPLRARETGTVANQVVALNPTSWEVSTDPREAGAVHRLDTTTSGVLVFAKTRATWEQTRAGFRNHLYLKTYLAVCSPPPQTEGIESGKIANRGNHAGIFEDGLPCETQWIVLDKQCSDSIDAALVRCSTQYGRRHQIRVHMAQQNAPLLGDEMYGGRPHSDNVWLHAESIVINSQRFYAPLPESRKKTLTELGLSSSEELGVVE